MLTCCFNSVLYVNMENYATIGAWSVETFSMP